MLFSQATSLLLMECQARNLSPNTTKFYKVVLTKCRGLLGDKKVASITALDLRRVLIAVPPSSARHYYVVLKRLFNFLVREGEMKRNPAAGLRAPKAEKKVIQALSAVDVAKLLAAAKANVHRGHNALRDVAMITTLLATGPRCAELCDLRDSDVRLEEGVLLVHGKGNRQRLVPLHSKLKPMLLRYTIHRDGSSVYDKKLDWFFRNRHGKKMQPLALSQMISKCAERAGIKAHTHRLRHTFASQFMSNDGADILSLQAIRGWADISMAQRYSHISMQKLQRSMEAFSPVKDI